MEPHDICYADVYVLVHRMLYICCLLGLLIVLQIVAKFVLLGRVYAEQLRIESVLNRVEKLLSLATLHGELTDTQRSRIADAVSAMREETAVAAATATETFKQSAEEVKTAVEQVPERVMERIRSVTN